jgi:hypothetical protein
MIPKHFNTFGVELWFKGVGLDLFKLFLFNFIGNGFIDSGFPCDHILKVLLSISTLLGL